MQDNNNWHQLKTGEALDALDSRFAGLTVPEAEARLEEYGFNEIEADQGISVFEILLAQIKNPLIYVLVAAGIISIVAGHGTDAIVIGAVIIVNTLIGFFQEYRAEEALKTLMDSAAPEAEVVRKPEEWDSYMEMSLPASYVVPGDVILIDEGAKVPADARLIEAHNLEVDEAMLTGESLSVQKKTEALPGDLPVAERKNLVYSGTIVTRGRGRAVVYGTGKATEMGEIATMIQETEKVTSPIQRQMGALSRNLGILATVVAGLTVLIGSLVALDLQEIFLFALASAVSSIPEGLPAVMSITLAVGVNRMAKRNAIIRRLPAVDTLGAASVICSDKTGTLTTNKMTVQEIWAGDKTIRVTGTGYKPEGQFLFQGEGYDPCKDEDAKMALKIGALCNNARLIKHKDGSEYWDIKGDPTEAALVIAAGKAGYHKESLEKKFHRVDELPFSSTAKFMATFHEMPDEPDKILALIKGAPEKILLCCESIQVDGEVQPLDEEGKEAILDHNHQMADQALRVLGLAYAVISRSEMGDLKEDLEYEHPVRFTFSGLSGMIDPPRKEVPQAVARCKKAGIRVIMATGDHKVTARAIAKEVGILEKHGQVITGSEVEKMDDEELQEALKSTSVFARVAPDHKHRMVQALQELGYVVAMTGDGVNDAPALQAAEIGIAMGITGTDVTKETAEMVLTDDNFASIVNAIEEGRVVFKNVQKVVKFLLATNIGEDLTLLTSLILFASKGLIIAPVQILWVNLVTDGILDITLAMEPKEEEVMDEGPRRRGSRIVNKEILLNIFIVALVMAAGTLFMYDRASNMNNATAQTVGFTTLAMFQVFNAFNCRSRTRSIFQMGFFKNPYLIMAVAASIILQVGAIYLPFMQNALGTTPLTLQDWGWIILVSSSILFVDEIRKLIQRKFFEKA